ncbi:MAG: hypothetical protein HGA94_02260, partial [Candidatus Aminicenantes bacterium]|nr:hypothetical protein [Candidatus Aminicenantes bacterium]
KEVEDDAVAADLVYQKTSARIMRRFRPLFDYTKGACGYVTIQADPREDDDADLIIKAALRHRKLGPNYMAKIPVIEAGLFDPNLRSCEDWDLWLRLAPPLHGRLYPRRSSSAD